MMSNGSYLPIRPEDLKRFNQKADDLLRVVSGVPKGSTGEKKYSLVTLGGSRGDSTVLLSGMVQRSLQAIREGLKVGMHLTDLYAQSSGLEILKQRNDKGMLTATEKDKFRDLKTAAAAIQMFVVAYHCIFELSRDVNGTLESSLPFSGVPEMDFSSPTSATSCMLLYLAAYLSDDTGVVKTERDFLRMTVIYFQAVIEEVKKRLPSFQYLEHFTDNRYKLEGSEFSVEGFNTDVGVQGGVVEFNRVSFDDIVGNEVAKKALLRLIQWMLSYDPVAKMNPAVELGAFLFVLMGLGKPGAGKTMLLSAMATKLTDRATWLGMPFIFHPMPKTLISTYQGGSAERMQEWMKPILEYSKGIGLAGIDDAEQYFLNRSRQEASEGVRQIISVFLTSTEGATAIRRGNWVILFLTNLAEQIDPAVLSRIMARFEINGAETPDEFGLQNTMWMKRYRELSPGFVNLSGSPGSILIPASVQKEITRGVLEPQLERIREVFEDLRKRCSLTEERFFGEFFAAVQRRFPNFRSREARNIHSAVSARIMDFDFPPDWMDSPETFFRKEYGVKKAMIIELMRENMGKLSFAEIFLEEAIRHIETFAQIADTDRERRITEYMSETLIRQEALKRLGH
ncbi:MAG: ATP-binding protein [Nitrososphaera sp.]|nr:ATP-binding protein [Nitrososphaera sp.]